MLDITVTAGENVVLRAEPPSPSLLLNNAPVIHALGQGPGNEILVTQLARIQIVGTSAVDNNTFIIDNSNLAFSDRGMTAALSGGGGNDFLSVANFDHINMPAQLYGGTGNDTLIGGRSPDVIDGGDGDDNLTGDGGSDLVTGGKGNDTLAGGSGDDTLNAGPGHDRAGGDGDNDMITGGKGVDFLSGDNPFFPAFHGNDTILGGGGSDVISGEGGNDSLWAGAGADSLSGGPGLDTLWGGTGNDTLSGGDEADSLWGGSGSDSLEGDNGPDQLHGDDPADAGLAEPDNDTLGGGNGNDTLTGGDDALLRPSDDDSLEGGIGDDCLLGAAGADTLYGGLDADTLLGGWGNDSLLGGGGIDSLLGERGNDKLEGGFGNDALDGGPDDDRYYFGEDNGQPNPNWGQDVVADSGAATPPVSFPEGDTLDLTEVTAHLRFTIGSSISVTEGTNSVDDVGATAENLLGGDGDDVFAFAAGATVAGVVFGGAGVNKLDYSAYTTGVNVDLDTGTTIIDGETVLTGTATGTAGIGNFQNVRGGSESDLLIGSGVANSVEGRAGDDTLQGEGGSDLYVYSQAFPAETLGFDLINEPGTCQDQDRLDFAGMLHADGIRLDLAAIGIQFVNPGHLTVMLSNSAGIENITGSPFADVLRGNDCNNEIIGRGGADTLYGERGGDTLYGSSGNDGLFGGVGFDHLIGGAGADRILWQPGDILLENPLPAEDARIDFLDGGATWTDTEVLRVDQALAWLHRRTNNTRLLKRADLSPLTFQREDSLAPGELARNDERGLIRFASLAFTHVVIPIDATVVHEIGHNWDNENANWAAFKAVSGWRKWPLLPPPAGYLRGSYDAKTTSWIYLATAPFAPRPPDRPGAEYGRKNPIEDFATSLEAYYVGWNPVPWQPKWDFVHAFLNGLASPP